MFLADIIAAELEDPDMQYVGASRRGPDSAEAMAVHWATILILCYVSSQQNAVIAYDSHLQATRQKAFTRQVPTLKQ